MKRTTFRNLSVTACIGLLILGCTNATDQRENAPDQELAVRTVIEWLPGTWASDDNISFEQWTKENDSSFRSKGFVAQSGDTSWKESGRLFKEDATWIFENTVKDQNAGKPIRFKAIRLDKHSIQFSNPEHDFPTDINYTLPDSNTMNAFIFGPGKNGRKDTIPFNFKRVH